jgi:hypothetical protein
MQAMLNNRRKKERKGFIPIDLFKQRYELIPKLAG